MKQLIEDTKMFNIGDVVKIKDEFSAKYSRLLEKAKSNEFKINSISRWKDGTVVLMFEGFDHFTVYAGAVRPYQTGNQIHYSV